MALQANYVVSASSNVDISDRVRAYRLNMISNAEQGSVALSTLEVDDPDGGVNIIGLRNIYLTETAEGSNFQRLYDGWTGDRTITRGQSFRTGTSRQWSVTTVDQNSLITRRIMRGSDANRPAETDAARIAWLLGTTEFGGVVTTSRYVSTKFPVAMDAVDYRDQSNQQILDDCSQASGKNFFIIYDEPVAAYGLYYDFAGNSPYRSSLQLSNVLGLIDNDIVFPVSEDSKLNRDPSRVYSGIVLPFVGGEVYVQSDAVANAFVRRDTTAPSVNVKTVAKATARANRYIADAATEADVITTSVVLPLAKVNHIMQGMSVQCWFAHFPGYNTGWNWMRVLNRTVVATSEEWYTLTLELAAAVGGLDAGGGVNLDGVAIPAPQIVAAVAPKTCVGGNGLTYSYTGPGTRTGLGPVGIAPYQTTSSTFMNYWGTLGGGSRNEYPTAGTVGSWGDGGVALCTFTSGGTDYTSGGSQILISFQMIGPGTLTVQTVPGAVTGGNGACGPSATAMTLTAYPSGAGPIASDTKAPGTTLTVVIPNDGYCAHYADLNGNGGWGFVSAAWTPA